MLTYQYNNNNNNTANENIKEPILVFGLSAHSRPFLIFGEFSVLKQEGLYIFSATALLSVCLNTSWPVTQA